MRCLRPELLDELAPDDPRAIRSRRDLRRVHVAMRTLCALERAIDRLQLAEFPQHILELGAGDGSLLLRLASAHEPCWPRVKLTLLDRQRVVNAHTLDQYRDRGWDVSIECEDVLHWAKRSPGVRYDLIIATLFLHHFSDRALRELLQGVATRCRAFIAIEPRRGFPAKMGSRLIGVLGVNAVTRDDAVTSVDAGFSGTEITQAWPKSELSWHTTEYRIFPFSHGFIAAQHERARFHA